MWWKKVQKNTKKSLEKITLHELEIPVQKNSVFDTKNRDRMTNQNYRTNQKSLIMSSNTKRKIYSISLSSLSSDVSLLLLKISASLCCISLIIPSVYGKKKSQILSWSFHTKYWYSCLTSKAAIYILSPKPLYNDKQYLSVFEGLLKEFLMMKEM